MVLKSQMTQVMKIALHGAQSSIRIKSVSIANIWMNNPIGGGVFPTSENSLAFHRYFLQ